MGFFSWRCAVSGKPILAGEVTWPADLEPYTKVVYVTRRGHAHATYDGYGRLLVEKTSPEFGPGEIPNLADLGEEPRLVLQHVYAGQAYADLEPSAHEPNQGFFWDEDVLRAVVEDLYPYPRGDDASCVGAVAGTLHAAGLEDLVEDRGGAGMKAWALSGDPETVAAAIAETDAAAKAAGGTPAQSEVCASLRDLASLLKEGNEPISPLRAIGEGESIVLAPHRGRRVRISVEGGRTILAVEDGAGGAAATALDPLGTPGSAAFPVPPFPEGEGEALGYNAETVVGGRRLRLAYDYRTVAAFAEGGPVLAVEVRS